MAADDSMQFLSAMLLELIVAQQGWDLGVLASTSITTLAIHGAARVVQVWVLTSGCSCWIYRLGCRSSIWHSQTLLSPLTRCCLPSWGTGHLPIYLFTKLLGAAGHTLRWVGPRDGVATAARLLAQHREVELFLAASKHTAGAAGAVSAAGARLYVQATSLQLMIESDQLQFDEIRYLPPMPPACKHMRGRRPATPLQAMGS
jgi:hypothetical protein